MIKIIDEYYIQIKIEDLIESVENHIVGIIRAFSNFLYCGEGIVSFRGVGGYEFDMILSYMMQDKNSNIYFVDNCDKIRYAKTSIIDLTKELILDIATNINKMENNKYKKAILKELKNLNKQLKDYETRKNKRVIR